MMIVEQGKVVDICAIPGEYVYDMSSEPSLFTGDLATNVIKVFEQIGKRFTFGGQPASDQRVYYFNIKEITGNKYGTPNAVPFRVVDKNVGIDIDIGIRCFGEYSYKIVNPILFYTNICGNVSKEYTKDEIDTQLKTELLTALQPAFAKLSEQGIRYSALPAHTMELADALNDVLSSKWAELRGIDIVSFGISSITANPEDEKMLKDLQKNAALKDPTMAAAHLVGAQAAAMQDAANNTSGAVNGFMGMNMASAAGGMNAANLYAMGQTAQPQAAAGWTCPVCGAVCTGNFCPQCGAKKPDDEWTCSCGSVNKGNFCPNCGAKKP
jgi:Putative virion core protein (lumpy skin disease virus)